MDVQRPIENNFTLPSLRVQFTTQNLISSKWWNSSEMLDSLFIKEFGRRKQANEYFDIKTVIKVAKTDENNWILLSDFPTFLLQNKNGNYIIKEF